MQRLERFLWLAAISVLASGTIWAQPLATGHSKFLGSIYSTAQAPNLTSYFNQVTPENAGKWGSVEVSRGVMNWTELDAAYALAKSNGLPFRFHVLVWGSQQPGWIETLTPAEQLEEIEEWFDAVAARYPDIDYLEVVNEPINQPPDRVGRGNYIGALGGAGATGWDWVIKAFEMARAKFPSKTKLMLNEYSVTTETARMNAYVEIVNLLKARDLIDAVGVQGHSFSHDPAYTTPASTKANLDLLWATEVPIMVTEFDIDGPTDQSQLTRYQNYFPVFWEHPGIIGMTLWGYRPGMWRATANLVTADYTERPAMTWLREYLKTETPTIRAGQRFSVVEGWENGHVIGAVRATDSDPETTFSGWTLTGGSGVGVFAIDADTGRLTLTNARALNAATKPSYTLEVRVSDGVNTSEVGTVTVNVLPEDAVPTRLVALATAGRGRERTAVDDGLCGERTEGGAVARSGAGDCETGGEYGDYGSGTGTARDCERLARVAWRERRLGKHARGVGRVCADGSGGVGRRVERCGAADGRGGESGCLYGGSEEQRGRGRGVGGCV